MNQPEQYKSKFYMRNLEQMQLKREMEEAKAEIKDLLTEKKLNYAQYVRDVHVPSVSFKKQQEMKNLKDRLKHPVR
jgi:hypothetical protein